MRNLLSGIGEGRIIQNLRKESEDRASLLHYRIVVDAFRQCSFLRVLAERLKNDIIDARYRDDVTVILNEIDDAIKRRLKPGPITRGESEEHFLAEMKTVYSIQSMLQNLFRKVRNHNKGNEQISAWGQIDSLRHMHMSFVSAMHRITDSEMPYIIKDNDPLIKEHGTVLQMQAPPEARYVYKETGKPDATDTVLSEAMNASGICLFGKLFGLPPTAMTGLIAAATGWGFDDAAAVRTGTRILNMRHVFNIREGIKAQDLPLPKRCVGEPPLTDGPLKGATINHAVLAEQFFEAVDWDKGSLLPGRESLENLGGMGDVDSHLYG